LHARKNNPLTGVRHAFRKIHRALAQGMNRFEVCLLVSKGVKATHKTGGRFEDSINDVLQYLGSHVTLMENLHPAFRRSA